MLDETRIRALIGREVVLGDSHRGWIAQELDVQSRKWKTTQAGRDEVGEIGRRQ